MTRGEEKTYEPPKEAGDAVERRRAAAYLMIIVPPLVSFLMWAFGGEFVLVMSERAGNMSQGAAVFWGWLCVVVSLASIIVMGLGVILLAGIYGDRFPNE